MKEYKKIIQEQERNVVKAQEKGRKELSGTLGLSETRSVVPTMRINMDSYAEALKSERQSKVAKAKKGTEGALKKSIRVLMGEMEIDELGELLAIFQNADFIEESFHSLHEPRIDIHEIEIYPDEGYITYAVRDGLGRKQTKLKTIQNHILKIRNS